MARLRPMIHAVNRVLRLGIRTKLLIAFIALSSVPVLLLGLYAIHVHRDSLELRALDGLRQQVTNVRERSASFLHGVASDMRLLQRSAQLEALLVDVGTARQARRVDELADVLADFLHSKDDYYQVRCFADGDHLLTVSRQEESVRIDRSSRTSGGAFYTHMVAGLPPGQAASTPVELSTRSGALVAAITYAVPLRADQGTRLILVLDLYARSLFHVVEQAHRSSGVRVVLVTGEGYYVYHSEHKTTWSQLLAAREDNNVFRDYPDSVAVRIMSGLSGMDDTGSEILAYAPLMPREGAQLGVYTLVMGAPHDTILAPVARFQRAFLVLLFVLVGLSVGLAWVAAAQFTRPIAALEREARMIARGDVRRRLHLTTYDEIQRLGETLNAMADAIQDREEALHHQEHILQDTVAERTRQLAKEKGMLQAILDSVPSAFVVLDRGLRIRSASSAFERLTGRSPTAVVGEPYTGVLPGSQTPAATALAEGRVASCVQEYGLPGGAHGYLERIAIPVTEGGGIGQVIEVVTDVTERKRMEAQVIQAEKLATTGEMAAVIAHEIRNSLTSVRLILQLELQREDRIRRDREAMGVALQALQEMETLVADLLRFARPAPLRLQPISITEVVDAAIALVRHRQQRRSLRLECALDPATPDIMGDHDQLKEVFVNLLLNATEAAPRGGHIIVRASQDSDAWVTICVADDGPGIAPDLRQRIFDPFFTTRLEGTGLGLSMARRTVEAHGGSIAVDSAPHGGACFAVRLPLARRMATQTP